MIGLAVIALAILALIQSIQLENIKEFIFSFKKTIMGQFEDFKAKLDAQSVALDSVKTNVTGISSDVAYLKSLVTENPGGLTAEQVTELSTIADNLSAKIDEIGATTASLDAETNPQG